MTFQFDETKFKKVLGDHSKNKEKDLPAIKKEIMNALAYLISMDPDYAQELNYVGFNKPDSYEGRFYASKGENLLDIEMLDAARMLRKYRNQLEGAGLNTPSYRRLKELLGYNDEEKVKELIKDQRTNRRKREKKLADKNAKAIVVQDRFNPNKKLIQVSFKYDRELVDAVRKVKQEVGFGFFDGKTKNWFFPIKAAKHIVDTNMFEFSEELLKLSENNVENKIEEEYDVYINSSDSEDFAYIQFEYDRKKIESIKSLPFRTRIWIPDKKVWKVQIEMIFKKLLELFSSYKVKIDPDVTEKYKKVKERCDKEEEAKTKMYDALCNSVKDIFENGIKNGNGDIIHLYNFQKEDIKQIFRQFAFDKLGGTIVAWDMGLGKTILSLIVSKAFSKVFGAMTAVVAPPSLKKNWLREAERVNIPIEFFSWRKQPAPLENFKYILIADECFPYETEVITDQGILPIGLIVEKKLPVKVLSCNLEFNALEWKPIVSYKERTLYSELYRIKHENGEFTCTENHKIWTEEFGYIRAKHLSEKLKESEITFRIFKNKKKKEQKGSKERKSFGSSRMVGIEVLESGNIGRSKENSKKNQKIYNLEVKGNHNYFAEGVLVSNCHHSQNWGYWLEETIQFEDLDQRIVAGRKVTTPRKFAKGRFLVDERICENGIREQTYKYIVGVKQTANFLRLALHKNCLWVSGLSGTPIKNGRPANLFAMLKACKHPLGKNKKNYEKRYCAAGPTRWSQWDATGSSHLNELHEETKNLIIRRRKLDVLEDLPPKIRFIRQAEVTKKRVVEYNMKLNELKTRYQERLMRGEIQQGGEALVWLGFLRDAASTAKIDCAVELAQEIIEEGNQVVLFTAFKESCEEIAKQIGREAEFFHGSTSMEKRDDIIQRFKNGKTRALVLTLKLGLGLEGLQVANNVILVDRPWTPGDADQAEDRCWRIGTIDTVNAVWLQFGEADERVDEIINEKRGNIDTILGEENGIKEIEQKGRESVASVAWNIVKDVLG